MFEREGVRLVEPDDAMGVEHLSEGSLDAVCEAWLLTGRHQPLQTWLSLRDDADGLSCHALDIDHARWRQTPLTRASQGRARVALRGYRCDINSQAGGTVRITKFGPVRAF